MIQENKIQPLLRAAETQLQEAGIITARLDAEILLAHVVGCSRLSLFSMTERLPEQTILMFNTCLARRLALEPVAYITGTQPFWSLDFKVNAHVLVPRPDTETLIETVLRRCPDGQDHRILDLGTGSGCILISLLSEYTSATGIGVDISEQALAVTRENAKQNGVAERCQFYTSDWFQNVESPKGGFSVIVSNPPYIRENELPNLMPDVRDFEPIGALDGGIDGLDPYRIIVASAADYLGSGGLLAVESGAGQAGMVTDIFAAAGFIEIEKTLDLAGIERVVSAKKA